MEKFLSDSQLRFLREARSVVESIEKDKLNKIEDPTDVFIKIAAIEGNLNLLIRSLITGGTGKDEFMKGFPKWNSKRMDSIKKLIEIAEDINSDKFKCNVSKLLGNMTSFVGGGVVLTALTGGLALPAGIAAGTFMTAAGTATSFGTAITELCLTLANVDKAKEIIKEDKKLLGRLNEWMEHSDKLIAAQSEVLKIDIVKLIGPSVENLVREGMEIKDSNSRLRYIEKKIKEIVRRTTGSEKISEMASLTIVTLLIGFYMLTSTTENRFLFDCASLTVKISTTAAIIFIEDILELAGLVSTNISKEVVTTTARGALAAIGMSLDAVSIILTSIDLYNGSVSSEAKKISDVAKKMEEEAEVLQNVYNKLK